MSKVTKQQGWQFECGYHKLPDDFYSLVHPGAVTNPKLVLLNQSLADCLGLTFNASSNNELAQLFSGNQIPEGIAPIAQAYAGHQFGHFTMLGDGRAHLLGEHITPQSERVDIQFKGSGPTPYSRGGDGRAVLGPMLREYIISEAMHALGIPTTRSLAVVTTGESVVRESLLRGAVLTRVASSHIRVGTFQYAAHMLDKAALKALADYTINRHYPALIDVDQPYLALLEAVMDKQIALVTQWLRVGFIHGVMNTDNMSICGETIDYGPCAFMDAYHADTVFSAIDEAGRYAFGKQSSIIMWNLARFAESLLPLLHTGQSQAISLAESVLNTFPEKFQQKWLEMMRQKLGLLNDESEDEALVKALLDWMQQNHQDYTNTFRCLSSDALPDKEIYQTSPFQSWWQRWQSRLQRNKGVIGDAFACMRQHNPVVIPRNHQVEAVLSAAELELSYDPLRGLLKVLSEPYVEKAEYQSFYLPPNPDERVYQTFCGT